MGVTQASSSKPSPIHAPGLGTPKIPPDPCTGKAFLKTFIITPLNSLKKEQVFG